MSIKRNIIANYVGQIYVTVIGILMVPLYIGHLGAEAYGLVGFFAMLQAGFNVLDLGLTPSIGRETARYHGGAMSALEYRKLFRALSVIFGGIALIGGGTLWLASETIATRWLHIEHLPVTEVVFAVHTMAISVALRWMGGLYRSVVAGSERLVWLSGFNVTIATLRFVGVFGSMAVYGYVPVVFFIHQLIVAILELGGLLWMSYRLLPEKSSLVGGIGWSFTPVRPMLKFALSIAFTSSVWVLVTQTDKFVLSGILPLAEYGYFTLAVLVASGVMLISAPISTAIMPRMARLHAEGKHEELIGVYRNATQWVSVIAGSAAVTVSFCAEHLLFAWTGDRVLAEHASPVLRLYAIGNGLLAVGAFPYYMQYAKGNLRYHLIGNAILLSLLIPTIIYAAYHFGGVGAGYVWMGMNLAYLLVWVAYVHRKLEPGLHVVWLGRDVMLIVLSALAVGFLYLLFPQNIGNKIESWIIVAVVGTLAISSAIFARSNVRIKFTKI